MSDCFDNTDPSSCIGLGTRFNQVVLGTVSVVPFDLTGWVAFTPCQYQLTIPALTHGQGMNPLVEVQRLNLDGTFEDVGVEIIFQSSGDCNLRVVINPDCRFAGRALFHR